MKKIAVLAILCCLLPTLLWSQRFAEDNTATQTTTDIVPSNWFIILDYTNIYDSYFASDAISVDAGWYVLRDIDVSAPDIWGDANMEVGPFVSLRMNSGKFNSQDYAEQIVLWTAGITTRFNFPRSQLTLNAQAGQLKADYTRHSGYESSRKSMVYSAELVYESDAGRADGQWFIPAWEMRVVGSTPTAPQKVMDWGFNELTHRLGEQGTNTSSVHVTASIDMFDVPFSESLSMPITIRGMGGKYNENIKYLGLGAGTAALYDKKPAVAVYVDKIWGWDNSKFDNWNLNFKFYLSFFQQIW